MADAVGAEAPDTMVLCLVPWVAVTEVKMATLDGAVSGRTLCLSLPLCRILSIDELRALLAHELAHFSHEEAGYARRVAPFHAGVSRALERLPAQARGMRRLAIAPPATLLGFFLNAVNEGERRGGGREARADRVAAAVAGADALASALVKVHAFAPAWEAVVDAMVFAVRSRTQYVNASALFHEVVSSNAGPERLQGLVPQELGHPTDRHPPLAQRLEALEVDPARLGGRGARHRAGVAGDRARRGCRGDRAGAVRRGTAADRGNFLTAILVGCPHPESPRLPSPIRSSATSPSSPTSTTARRRWSTACSARAACSAPTSGWRSARWTTPTSSASAGSPSWRRTPRSATTTT